MEETAIEPVQAGGNQVKVSSQAITTTESGVEDLLNNEDKLTLLLFGDGEFEPTLLMCQLVTAFIRQTEDFSPMKLLKEMGHARQNWYLWQHEYPGFLKWWNRVIEDIIKEEYLSGMYLQLLKRARTHDTGAAKLIAQRYDPKYVERSAQDQRHSFAGYEPAAADDSRDRQRKAIASTALPDGPEQRTGGPDIPALPEPAQELSTEQAQPEQASNDTSVDSKPIKPIEGAGEGV